MQCDRCAATFAKAKQLRDHVAAEHMPEGTKPFICEHPGCGASFALRTKLKNHMHTHDSQSQFPSFRSWVEFGCRTHADFTSQPVYLLGPLAFA